MNVPQHVAIILDGNRRFGQAVLGDAIKGHDLGANKLTDVIGWIYDLGVKTFTVWGFSTENFGRPEEEVKAIMNLFEIKLKELITNEAIHKHKIKVTMMGRTDLFSEQIQKLVRDLTEATKHYSNYQFNIAVGYGGEQELIDATKKIARQVLDGKLKPEDIDNKLIYDNMYVFDLPKIDLVIRTGGAVRTSGFAPLQAAYAEWWFTEKLWPEFEREDLIKAFVGYADRQRRFGK